MHNKKRGEKRPSPSIDGFVPGNRPLGAPVRSYQPNRDNPTPNLGTFINRTDGFHSSNPTIRSQNLDSSEAEEAGLLDEPIVLDHIEDKNRKARFGQRHPKFKRRLKRTALTLSVIILAAAGFFGYKLYHTQKKVLAGGGKAASVCSDDVPTSQLNEEGDSRINVLLLGIGGAGHDGADLTDTIMLASIDPITDKVTLLSIPRDLWVKIPGDGYQKLNATYYYGKQRSNAKEGSQEQKADGLALLDQTLKPIIDVPIHYHVLVDFSAFKQAVDAVGGVTVNVPETLYDPTIAWENFNNPVIAKQGIQNFNGQQALLYARSRETSSDFARGERQRLLLVALKQKITSSSTLSNPIKLSNLLDSLGDNVYTDFDSTSIKCLYKQTSAIPSSAITSLDMVKPPNNLLTTGNMNGLSVVEPRAGVFAYAGIQKFVHSSLKDGFLAKENASVAVYNATDVPGAATAEAEKLKQLGYKVTTVANTAQSSNPSTTNLVDTSGGKNKYTRNYLEKRLGVSALGKLPASFGITPPQGTAFVIILGEDVANTSQF